MIYNICPVAQTPEERSLEQIMSRHPDKRDMILRNMKETLSVLVDKYVPSAFRIESYISLYFMQFVNSIRIDQNVYLMFQDCITVLHSAQSLSGFLHLCHRETEKCL